jgi:hypothetical protein
LANRHLANDTYAIAFALRSIRIVFSGFFGFFSQSAILLIAFRCRLVNPVLHVLASSHRIYERENIGTPAVRADAPDICRAPRYPVAFGTRFGDNPRSDDLCGRHTRILKCRKRKADTQSVFGNDPVFFFLAGDIADGSGQAH